MKRTLNFNLNEIWLLRISYNLYDVHSCTTECVLKDLAHCLTITIQIKLGVQMYKLIIRVTYTHVYIFTFL